MADFDPTLLDDALPDGSKPYTGALDVMADLVVRVMTAAHQFGINVREGMPEEENLAGLKSVVDGVRDILAGKDDAYKVLDWHRDGLSVYLRDRFSMGTEPDPVEGFLSKVALDTVTAYQQWTASEIDDSTAELHLGAIKTEAIRDLLGLPDERATDG